MTRIKDEHLGDGVYLSDDGYQLWLAVNHHEHKVIALESRTFLALVEQGAKRFDRVIMAAEFRAIANRLSPEENGE